MSEERIIVTFSYEHGGDGEFANAIRFLLSSAVHQDSANELVCKKCQMQWLSASIKYHHPSPDQLATFVIEADQLERLGQKYHVSRKHTLWNRQIMVEIPCIEICPTQEDHDWEPIHLQGVWDTRENRFPLKESDHLTILSPSDESQIIWSGRYRWQIADEIHQAMIRFWRDQELDIDHAILRATEERFYYPAVVRSDPTLSQDQPR